MDRADRLDRARAVLTERAKAEIARRVGAVAGSVVEVADAYGVRGRRLRPGSVAHNVPPYSHRLGRPYIDGYAPGQQTPGTFTLLAGLLLTDQSTDNGGNLWVRPGTHLSHAAFLASSGPQAFGAAGGHPDVELRERPRCG